METAQTTYTMLENQSLWTTAVDCRAALEAVGIPHAIVGGVAVCLHGYRRNTVDLDLLIRREDQQKVREALEACGYQWSAERAEFRSPAGMPVQFLLSGEKAGKDTEVLLPSPDSLHATVEIEGLTVLSLARLIEIKLACGLGSPRRTHRDLADVVELISSHHLGRDFARHLHKSLRAAFRKLVEQSRA
ncbi:MAG TPA: hypothetical protein VGI40_25960 [Pirellulaceae bacterium]|jgi:hypothetical protein